MGIDQAWRYTCDNCGSTTYRMREGLPRHWEFWGTMGMLMCRACLPRWKPIPPEPKPDLPGGLPPR